MSNETITVDHPALTVGELCDQITARQAPVRRSAHVGNQPAHELLLMTAAPPGIEIVLVDTIQGNDEYHQGSPPKMVRVDSKEPIPLCRKKGAAGRVVGSILVDETCLPKNPGLVCLPEAGDTLLSFHCRAIDMLQLTNRPMTMTSFFAQHAELFAATMLAAQNIGEVSRAVAPAGVIETVARPNIDSLGIFGLNDATPENQGAMVPLNAMMALDMAISAHAQNSDKTTHLAGRHMAEYTRDRQRMRQVGLILAKTLAEVGMAQRQHCYEVVDVTGLANLVSRNTYSSQHQLLRIEPNISSIDLRQFRDEPCKAV